jgi:excisionase family DNA binding protein
MSERLTVTAREAAEMLGVSRRFIYELVASGRLPRVPHLGSRVLIPKHAVTALVESATTEAVG